MLTTSTAESSSHAPVSWFRRQIRRTIRARSLISAPPAVTAAFSSRRPATAALIAILALAFGLRIWRLFDGIPYAVGVDEPAVVERAFRMVRTGDWNPHFFDYPAFVMYTQAVIITMRFLWGAAHGQWASLSAADIAAFYAPGRLVAALFGTALVWITYRTARELGSSALGIVAAAEVAVLPLLVRESHYILADVPATCFATLALGLALRAGRLDTAAAYACAGAAAGLATGAKYNGAVAAVAIALVWLTHLHRSERRTRNALAAAVAMAAAFLLSAPYTILDLPSFLNAFAALGFRFAPGSRRLAEPAAQIYLKHLMLAGRVWLSAAAIGTAFILWRREMRWQWLPVVGFVAAYFYVLATHPLVFARYALPLIPALCLIAAVPVEAVARLARRIHGPSTRLEWAAIALGTLLLTGEFGWHSIEWLRQLRHPDTREIVAQWLIASSPPLSRTRIALESDGPTNLAHAGFSLEPTHRLLDHPLEWYRRAEVEYLVISATDLEPYAAFTAQAPTVLTVLPSPERWGPPIRILRLPIS